jgi:hypothetical protein
MHLRTADACDKTTDDLAATELLFAVDEGKCMKSKAAIDAFKSNKEGKALIALCETTTTTTTTVEPVPSFDGNGMGTQCRMFYKGNIGQLTHKVAHESALKNSRYTGCHEKSNDWAKIDQKSACNVEKPNSYGGGSSLKSHRTCSCSTGEDCKAMCVGDPGCVGYVDKTDGGCQWATTSEEC